MLHQVMFSRHTWVAQVGLVSCCLVADVLDTVVEILIGFRKAGSGNALVGCVV